MIAVALTILLSCSYLCAQQAATAAKAIGTVSSVNGNTVIVKTDSGAESSVTVQDSTRVVQTAPGQKDLKQATPIHVQDIQVGDRILARGTPSDDGKSVAATTLVVMKQGDVAQKQEQERQQWQRSGSGGIVRSVDPASGTIVVSVAPNRTLTIRTSSSTQFLRYAPGSVNFSDATKGTIDQIKAGDQLRARGARNTDASELTAEAVISGSFRNIAGVVTSVDSGANTVVVNDLVTKKPVTVKITADTQMRKLPAPVAQRIAMYVKGSSSPASSEAGQQGGNQQSPNAAGERRFGGQSGPNGASGGAPDFQQMIRRMPAATISDLQKGDAVMIVTTAGDDSAGVTALTLLSGVEPILTASPTQSSAASLLSGWSVGGGAPEAQ
jgi:hypothetical protein